MKPLLPWTLALLGLAGTARAQELRGDYVSTNGGFVTDFFHFQGNTFTYTQSGCTGLTKGAGTFSIQHDTLYLSFRQLSEPERQIATYPAQETGTFTVRVVDGTNRPILGAYVHVRPTRASNKSVGAATDLDTGKAVFAYTPIAGDSLMIGCIGYAPRYVPLGNLSSNCIQVVLGFTDYIPAQTVRICTLRNLGHYAFNATYLPNGTESQSRLIHYKRITARRATTQLKLREQAYR